MLMLSESRFFAVHFKMLKLRAHFVVGTTHIIFCFSHITLYIQTQHTYYYHVIIFSHKSLDNDLEEKNYQFVDPSTRSIE